MEFFKAVRERRSVRQFKRGDVPARHVEKILNAGRLAPSGCNLQNKEFIVIRDKATIEKLKAIQDSFKHVPVVIAVVMTPTRTSWGSYWVEDCAACVENMLLAITALGYGSVWVEGTVLAKEQWAKKLLGVPADKRLYVLLPVARPATRVKRPPKKSLEEIVHYERYGGRKPE